MSSTPTQKSVIAPSAQPQQQPQQQAQQTSPYTQQKTTGGGGGRPSYDRDGSTTAAGSLQPPPLPPPSMGRLTQQQSSPSLSMREQQPPPRPVGSFAGPGSFSSDLRSQMTSSRAGSRMDLGYASSIMNKVDEDDYYDTPALTHTNTTATGGSGGGGLEQTVASLKDRLNRELKIREGSENMLEALHAKKAKQTRDQRTRVEAELSASNQRIKDLRSRIADAQFAHHQQQPTPAALPPPSTPTRNNRDRAGSQNSVPRSWAGSDAALAGPGPFGGPGAQVEDMVESPTFALAELLQALEVEGMTPEYYVGRGNLLVDLFKRHPTLKYDLVWSVFGLRMQVMLLSESREVAAAGYRMTRYAISDRASLRKIRSLNTDFLVIRYVALGLDITIHCTLHTAWTFG